jgi:hypothetical protein
LTRAQLRRKTGWGGLPRLYSEIGRGVSQASNAASAMLQTQGFKRKAANAMLPTG